MSLFGALLICLAPVATDGDGFRCGGGKDQVRVRLFGVDHPDGTNVVAAMEAVTRQTTGGVICEPRGASYNRIVAICYNGTDRDVGRQLLEVDRTVVEWCAYSKNYYGTCVAPIARKAK